MLTRLLDDLGFFVGHQLESNHESTFFLRLNSWLLEISGADWDQPEPFEFLLDSESDRTLALEHLEYVLASPKTVEFLGWRRFFRDVVSDAISGPWGWKDPRNTLTLPFWLELFPNAKILYIERHGVDVARSLRDRREDKMDRGRRRYRQLREKFGSLYWLRDKRSGFGGSVRCHDLDGGFSLWEHYVRTGRRHVEEHDDRALKVRYEEFLESPAEHLENVAEFCGLQPDSHRIEEAVRSVDSSRAYAFHDSADLEAFASRVGDTLQNYGY